MRRFWLAWTPIVIAGCVAERPDADTEIRYPKTPTEENADDGRLLPAPPHGGDPCTRDCRHYTFGGNWVRSHRHSQGCGHSYDKYLKFWMVE